MNYAPALILLGLVWAVWCALHSLLLWRPLRAPLERTLRLRPSVYRVLFSLLSLLTISPLIHYTLALGGILPFFWDGAWIALQLALWLGALALMWWALASFRRGGFDMVGLDDALKGRDRPHRLVTSGAYAHLRHPMHLAGLVMLWARHLSPADLVVNLVLSAYIVIGSQLEEHRLLAMFGHEYRAYQARAPMLGWRFRP